MLSRTLPVVVAFAGTIAASPWVFIPTAAGAPLTPSEGHARYAPVQSIGYAFGSKAMSGYFVQQDQDCAVTLMIAEKGDPENPSPLSPTRVRLLMKPGEIAGLDSEEGTSLNLTCGEGAKTLLVDLDERDRLVALQRHAPENLAAKSQ